MNEVDKPGVLEKNLEELRSGAMTIHKNPHNTRSASEEHIDNFVMPRTHSSGE